MAIPVGDPPGGYLDFSFPVSYCIAVLKDIGGLETDDNDRPVYSCGSHVLDRQPAGGQRSARKVLEKYQSCELV